MMRVLRVRASLLAIGGPLALGLAGCGGSSVPPQSPASLANAVDGVVNAALQQQSIPAIAVALAKNGTILYAQAYGFSNLVTHQASQTNTIFEIGSITKQFTAALIMKLQEQGKLQVDDSINLYLPEYGFPPAITLRMLLTHTSGLWDFTTLPQYQGWAVNGVSEATVLTAVSQAPLEFKPGTSYSYSNSNFFALGAVIEKVTGVSYEANLQQYIFQPLGLTNTYYSLPPAAQSAIGYINSGVRAIVVDRSAPFAAGALSSNVFDLVAWDNVLINGKVVSPASFKAMTTSNGFTIPGGGSYGFGLGLDTFNNRNIIVHDGAINGFTAENLVFLDNGFTVVVLTNDDAGNPGALVINILDAVCNSTQLSGNC
jgi:CubicO group peptidase (beta-lactamase class C family)